MNQYLFLFPIKEYFESSLEAYKTFTIKEHDPSKLINIINIRYREQGYGINWLLFSQEDNLSKPDLSQVPDYVEIKEHDNILVAGISFKKHIQDIYYMNIDYVINQLKLHNKLVLGGFHQWDCVDKIAKRSYENGIETFVDEDTTELFFGRQAFDGVPLIRENWNLIDLGINNEYIEQSKEIRKNKPWFVQN